MSTLPMCERLRTSEWKIAEVFPLRAVNLHTDTGPPVALLPGLRRLLCDDHVLALAGEITARA